MSPASARLSACVSTGRAASAVGKYTIILEDTPTGSVSVRCDEMTHMQVAAIAAGVETSTAAFDYATACINVCKDRSKGISREVEKRIHLLGS